jgi:hypothetical protein
MSRVIIIFNFLWLVFFSNAQIRSDDIKIKSSVNGNLYLFAKYSGVLKFSPTDSIGNFYDMTGGFVLCKMDSLGNVIWHREIKGCYGDNVGVCCDGSDNVYVTATFMNTLTINTNTIAISNSQDKAFIAKFSSNGVLNWCKVGGGSAMYSYGSDISIDQNKNLYVIGRYYFGSFTFGNVSPINWYGMVSSFVNYDDIYVAKLDSNGNDIWINSINGGVYKTSRSITTTTSGISYITADCGAGSMFISGTNTYSSTFNAGGFITSFDQNGNFNWLNKVNNSGYHYTFEGTTIDMQGNIYGNGKYSTNANFGSNQLFTNPSGNTADGYIIKYATNGTDLFAKQASGNNQTTANYGECTGIAYDSFLNSVYVIGYQWPSINFPPLNTLAFPQDKYEYLARLNVNGLGLCNMSLTQFHKVIDVTTDQFGRAIVAGNNSFGIDGLRVTRINNNCTQDWTKLLSIRVYYPPVKTHESTKDNFLIYPNPTNTNLNIQIKGKGQLVIYNAIGNLVIKDNLIDKTTINISELPSGIYLVEIHSDSGKYSQKLLIQH